MALDPVTQLLLLFKATLKPNGDEEGGQVLQVGIDELLANGTGTRQANDGLKDIRVLGAGATETVNWSTLTNANGDTISPAEIVVFGIMADAANGAGIQLDDSPGSPWLSFFRSSGATDNAELEVLPGGFLFAGTVLDPAYATSGGNDAFLVTNLDGSASATYTLFALTRDA